MTIGIYCLKFKDTNKVYIGQSDNIERRLKEHLYKLKNNTANYKLLEAYKIYGAPSIEILCECSIEDLDKTENEAIEIFDAVDAGFNVQRRAKQFFGGKGDLNSFSKCSNTQVEAAFKLLIGTSFSIENISTIVGISINTVYNISSSKKHLWLEDKFPEEYKVLRYLSGNRNSAVQKGIVYPKIKSPDGEIYVVTNGTKFAQEQGLDQGTLNRLLNGKRKTHKGWCLA